MREIKFRAWHEQSSKYIPFGSYVGAIYCKIDLERGYVLEQYTGLKDKNGKEIYEGDIYYSNDTKENHLVEFFNSYDGDGYPMQGFVFECYWRDNDKCDDIEVVGNIHENAELLA